VTFFIPLLRLSLVIPTEEVSQTPVTLYQRGAFFLKSQDYRERFFFHKKKEKEKYSLQTKDNEIFYPSAFTSFRCVKTRTSAPDAESFYKRLPGKPPTKKEVLKSQEEE
jgi:hypothetical protein